MQQDVVILDGARTPWGAFGGGLRNVSATDLGVAASREALRRAGVPAEKIDNVVFGNVIQSAADTAYLARHVGLKAGLRETVPALTINRLCGSGLQALVTAAQSIMVGESRWALAGGAENMSMTPHVLRGARWGIPLGQAPMADYLWEVLYDPYAGCGMAETAENLGEQYGVTREEADQFAYESQVRARQAMESGRLAREIVPVEGADARGKPATVAADEHPRPNTTPEALARLTARFRQNGTVTAGNASGINDGAAALVLTSYEEAEKAGLRPLCRLVAWGVAGVPPRIMGIGPAPASQLALERAGLAADDIDLWEINEAFATQYLAVEKELGLDRSTVNVNGGAVALGHPVGASGARLALTLAYELKERGGRYGVAALCIGGGQGIAAVIENLN